MKMKVSGKNVLTAAFCVCLTLTVLADPPNTIDTSKDETPPISMIDSKSISLQPFAIFNPKEDLNTYQCSKNRFSLGIPDSWSRSQGYMGTALIAMSKPEHKNDQFRENLCVVVEPLPQKMGLDSYYAENIENMKKLLTDLRIFKSGTSSLNGQKARWIVYSYRMGALRSKGKCYLMVKNGKGYALTFTAAPVQYERYSKFFDKIANTFTLN